MVTSEVHFSQLRNLPNLNKCKADVKVGAEIVSFESNTCF